MDTNKDEHDLAKALDDVTAELDAAKSGGSAYGDSVAPAFGSEPVVLPGSPVAPAPITPPRQMLSNTDDPTSDTTDQPADEAPAPYLASPLPSTSTDEVTGPLADIKKDALNELRPLVDKLNVSSEEKFDTYLLLIRSTDDKELIAPAHEAAKAIEDETRRAEALLDIIKEIDYLSHPKQ